MNSSVLAPRLEALGARLAVRPEAPGLPTVLTFGDVPAEYAAVREGCALLDATDRGRLRIRGGDAAGFLHRILANDVHTLAPGSGNRNLLLSGKGKVQHDFDLACDDAGFTAQTAPGAAEALRAGLDLYLFADDVELIDETGATAPLELCGPKAAEVVRAVVGVAPEGAHAWAEGDGPVRDGPVRDGPVRDGPVRDGPVRVTALPIAGVPGFRIDAGPERAPALWDALVAAGAAPIGVVVRDIVRVEQGTALWGVDITEDVYPQEARLEDAFSLDKGCYIGQEVVAKIDTYGGLNKLLVALRVDHDDPVPPGTRLRREDPDKPGEWRDLGQTTSWAYSFRHDTGLVLAYAKRRHQAPGTPFRLGDNGATAAIIDPS